jgi:hypothetical protein
MTTLTGANGGTETYAFAYTTLYVNTYLSDCTAAGLGVYAGVTALQSITLPNGLAAVGTLIVPLFGGFEIRHIVDTL